MAIRINRDFEYRLMDKTVFRARNSGLLFVTSTEMPSKNEEVPLLNLYNYCSLIHALTETPYQKCTWLVECPSKLAANRIQESYSDSLNLNGSIAGVVDHNLEEVKKFWTIQKDVFAVEAWNTEQPWAMVGLLDELPAPNTLGREKPELWCVDHVIRYRERIRSVFVQFGWFSFFGVRESAGVVDLIEEHFPGIGEEAGPA